MDGRELKRINNSRAQASYWLNQITEMPLPLKIIGDYSRSPVQSFFRNRLELDFEKSLCEKLRNFCDHKCLSLFVVILGSFHFLLKRYTGQEDIVIGTVSVDSVKWKTENDIEQFVNPLALRVRLTGNPTVYNFLQSVARVVDDASQNRDYPFSELVGNFEPDDDPSRGQIFQTMVLFLGIGSGISSRAVSKQDRRYIEEYSARCDLVLHVSEESDLLKIECEYDTDLFMPSTIQRILAHFQTIVTEMVGNPEQLLSDLSCFGDNEREQMLFEWNNTHIDYPKEHCVHHLFEWQCNNTPNNIAVVFGNKFLTYQELNSRSNQVAHYLVELGVGPETLVGINIGRSLDMLVGLLGIMKSGGTYVPLDPSVPQERLSFILTDTKLSFLLAPDNFANKLVAPNLRVIRPGIEWHEISKRSKKNLNSSVTGGNLAYIIYTSGSTGIPKGVQIEHHSVVNLLLAMQQQFRISEKDIILATTTLFFDISALELFLPLITGAQVVIVRDDEILSGTQLLGYLSGYNITIMQATPVTWRLLLDAGWLNSTNLKILCGGEVFPQSLATQLLARSTFLWNMYGPTETTIWSSTYQVVSGDRPIPVGRPIANTQIYLLDRYLQPLPIGAPGEIYIGGDGLARGYLNSPYLTAERFIPDPFSGKIGARLYQTGDWARFKLDGTLEFLGRSDYQVKIRGHRIELGEIESIISQFPPIDEVVVIIRDDVNEEKI